jgi:hypothetical protein
MIKFASPACCAFHQFKAASLLDSGRFGISAYSQLNVAAFASLRLALRPCVQARCNATQRLQVRLVTFCHLVSLRRADHSWMPQCQTPTARFGADVQMHVIRWVWSQFCNRKLQTFQVGLLLVEKAKLLTTLKQDMWTSWRVLIS